MTDREQAIRLRKKGRSLTEIVEILNKPKSTIYGWVADIPVPQNRSKAARKGWATRKHNQLGATKQDAAVVLQGSTKFIGDVGQLAVIAQIAKRGYKILMPYGDSSRYDFVIEKNNKFYRVQVKVAQFINGAIRFETRGGYTRRGVGRKSYENDADFFGVYSPHLDKCYLIPVGAVGKTQAVLRIATTDADNQHGIRYADKYTI